MPKRILYEAGYIFPGTYLEVIENMPSEKGKARVRCICFYKGCGKETVISAATVKKGDSKSCGCLRNEKSLERKTKHGLKSHPLYRTWVGMITRCENKKRQNYSRYGGRGISVCSEWRSDFQAFHAWAMASGWETGLEIDRINNDGNYTPGNCRFVTKKENCRNRSKNVVITIDGATATIVEHAEMSGIPYFTIIGRYKNNWPVDELLLPVGNKRTSSCSAG